MPEITFLPLEKTVSVDPGTLLSDAARSAGIPVDLPCGGKGVCGRCLARVVSGTVTSDAAAPEGFAAVCRSRVGDGPVTLKVGASHAEEDGRFSGAPEEISLEPELQFDGPPLAERVNLTVPEPKAGDGLSDLDRFSRALSAALGDMPEVPLGVLVGLPDALRETGGTVAARVYRGRGHVISVGAERKWGLAADIGTTTVAAHLVDLDTGLIAASQAAYNAQIDRGLDVISRIHYARTPERRDELKTKIVNTLNALIETMAAETGVSADDIAAVSLAGNTTMIHLLLGVQPEYIRLAPYTPAALDTPVYRAGELGLRACPYAPVRMAPAVGSYVGGDILSGLLCTRLAEPGSAPMLLIDIGTNGELVLGGEDFLLACACSAGPAFEGGGIRHGCRASRGAIERVALDGEGNVTDCSVIGNAPATGLCGSGAISLTAELFRRGLVDASGHFAPNAPLTGDREFRVSGDVTFSETDIDNLIRAKAAVFSACRTLLAMVGLDFSDLGQVYVAGGFGRYLDLEDAATIGLLPRVGSLRFLGNASLTGAYLTLMHGGARDKLAELAGRVTYIDLSTEPGYMDEYTAALFLPHTTLRM